MNKFDETNTHDYVEFLNVLMAKGYKFCFFREIINYENAAIVLRHDIDFDCELAYEMAAIENQYGIRATYFFLVTSESYNIASADNSNYIRKIQDLGHEITIHFDPLVHDSFEKGFNAEVTYFENLFGVKINIVSIHRPNDFFLNYDKPINNVEHTYQSKYFKQLKYFADSTGIWRFGHPFNSDEFQNKMNLHILIHPIWWMLKLGCTSNSEKIKSHYFSRIKKVKEHYNFNCKAFSIVYNEI